MNLQINTQEMKIRMARFGLSQRGLAEKSGVSRQTLSNLVNGKRVSPIVAGKISAALGCDVTEIVTQKGED